MRIAPGSFIVASPQALGLRVSTNVNCSSRSILSLTSSTVTRVTSISHLLLSRHIKQKYFRCFFPFDGYHCLIYERCTVTLLQIHVVHTNRASRHLYPDLAIASGRMSDVLTG